MAKLQRSLESFEVDEIGGVDGLGNAKHIMSNCRYDNHMIKCSVSCDLVVPGIPRLSFELSSMSSIL